MKNLLMVLLCLCFSIVSYGSLVAHYEFEGNLTDSAGSYDGSAAGTIAYAACGLAGGNQCLDLTTNGGVDGHNGVVLDGTESLFDATGKATIAFWYKAVPTTTDARWDAFVSKLFPGSSWDGAGWSVRMYSDSEDVAWTTRLSVSGYASSNGYNVRDGQWHHIVVSYVSGSQKVVPDTNTTSKIYIDGSLVTTKNWAGDYTVTASSYVPISIGVSIEYTGEDFIYRDGQYGYMDDVRLYDNILTNSEVTDLYNSTFTVPVVVSNPQQQIVNAGSTAVFTVGGSGVIDSYAWYKSSDPCNATPGDDAAVGTDSNTLTIANVQLANEGYYYCVLEGTVSNSTSEVALLMTKRLVSQWNFENNLNDSVGANNGTRHGGGSSTYGSGVVGSSALLVNNDANDAIDILYNPQVNTESFTVAGWAKAAIDSNGTSRGFFNGRTTTPNGGTFTYLSSTNKWISKVRNSSGTEYTVTGTSIMSEDQWQFVAFTFEATGKSGADIIGTGTLYVNGLVEVQTPNMSYNPNTTANIVIGSVWTPSGGYYNIFNGYIDDIRYYNYALGVRDVGQIYADGTDEPLCVVGSVYDFNGDCLVNFKDFAEFATEWLDDSFVYPNN
jgi:hypothetical protein